MPRDDRPGRPHGVRRLFRLPRSRRRLAAEIDDELRFHLERRREELIAAGMEPAAARREAERRFGDRAAVRRECRRIDGERETRRRLAETLGGWLADVRMAGRQLLRAPGFALLAVFTLALGIGGASAIYSVVHAVLLRALPVDDPGRVVLVWESRPGGGKGDASPGNFDEWRRHAGSFTALAAAKGVSVNLAGERPERVVGLRVNAAFFDVLGVEPAAGRTFDAEEDRPGADPVAVLSHALWQRRFAGDDGVVGRTVRVDGAPHAVVGVMPERFDRLGLGSDLWLPVAFTAERLADHDGHSYLVFGRLAAGVSARAAEEELAAVTARMQAADPDDQRNLAPLVVPLAEELVDEYRLRLWTLFAAVALVLLIACVNVSNLLLARGTARSREMAVRTALGAGRGRLLRGLLIESLLLALAAAAAGLGLAAFGVRALVSLAPAGVPRLDEAAVDAPTLVFAVAAAVFTALAAGLLPALRASRRRPQEALARAGRGLGAGRDRLRAVLVTAELALAFTLLVAAGLLVRSAVEVSRVDPGFETSGVLTARLTLDGARYGEPRRVEAAYEELVERAAALPGVTHAAAANQVPLGGGSGSNGLLPEGREPVNENFILSNMRLVTPGHLDLLRVPLLAGRPLSAEDRRGAPPVMLVNETLARLAFPDGSAVGRRIGCCVEPENPEVWKTVVGVVGDVRGDGLDSDPPPTFYLPMVQAPPDAWNWLQRTMVLAVRTDGDPGLLVEPLRQVVLDVDTELPVWDVATLDERLATSRAESRFTTALLLALAAVGTLLAAVGLYGTVAYVVEQRRHEIGVRMALGATAARVVRTTAAALLPAIAGGLAVGLVGALAAGRAVESLLFGVGGGDPWALAAAAGLLAVVALAACLLPARRAARVDPVRTLGAE